MPQPRPLAPALAIAAAALAAACAPAPAPVVTVAVPEVAAAAPGPTPAERLIALLTADNPRLEQIAMSIAGLGDAATTRLGAARLVAMAREMGSAARREQRRAELRAGPGGEGLSASLVEAEIANRETADLTPVLAAMSHLGGPTIIAHCFALAEDEGAPAERRWLALRVLDLVLGEGESPERLRYRQTAVRVPRPTRGAWPGGERGSLVAITLRPALKRCYQRALQSEGPFQGSTKLIMRVQKGGRVAISFEGDRLPPSLERCIAAAISDTRAPPDQPEGSALSLTLRLVNP